MTEYQDELLADAARVVATDLYPVRCRTLIANLAAEVEALRKRLDEAERLVPRFPDHMAAVFAAKHQGLPERMESLVAAMEKLPEDFRKYQWVADARPAFGEKIVRAVSGDNGEGRGRQAIAYTVSHIDGLADFIAAANPDTLALLLARIDAKPVKKTDDDLIRRGDALKVIDPGYGDFHAGHYNAIASLPALARIDAKPEASHE